MRIFSALLVLLLAGGVGGCETIAVPAFPNLSGPPPLATAPPPIAPVTLPPPAFQPIASETIQNPADVRYYASDERVRLGMQNFSRGYYGMAASYFLEATQASPRDATAWIGLAASYDRLGRFALADHAYAAAIALVGETPEILNDRGYSAMLRNDFPAARGYLMRAYQVDPTNPYVLNNLRLLNESEKSVIRNPQVPLIPLN
jgi:Tfp pilus assembly protein PilF